MARKTQLDRAIEQIDTEIATLVAARERLVKQREEQKRPPKQWPAADALLTK
jgi:hypothetical protein